MVISYFVYWLAFSLCKVVLGSFVLCVVNGCG